MPSLANHPKRVFSKIEKKQFYKQAFETNRLTIDGDMLIFNIANVRASRTGVGGKIAWQSASCRFSPQWRWPLPLSLRGRLSFPPTRGT
jgi:hypothetical protein